MKTESIMIDRRTAIQWVIAAGAALGVPTTSFSALASNAGSGYGKDPELLKAYKPGELWPLTLTAEQKEIARILGDTIIPREGDMPSASAIGAVEFIDEWISAPYESFAKDKALVMSGFAWLEKDAQRRFGQRFATLTATQIAAICDEICQGSAKKPADEQATAFFTRFRTLTAIAYYTTPLGMKDLGYVGNVPLREYAGPPADVLKKVGLS